MIDEKTRSGERDRGPRTSCSTRAASRAVGMDAVREAAGGVAQADLLALRLEGRARSSPCCTTVTETWDNAASRRRMPSGPRRPRGAASSRSSTSSRSGSSRGLPGVRVHQLFGVSPPRRPTPWGWWSAPRSPISSVSWSDSRSKPAGPRECSPVSSHCSPREPRRLRRSETTRAGPTMRARQPSRSSTSPWAAALPDRRAHLRPRRARARRAAPRPGLSATRPGLSAARPRARQPRCLRGVAGSSPALATTGSRRLVIRALIGQAKSASRAITSPSRVAAAARPPPPPWPASTRQPPRPSS